jgi:hypothetical protein
MMGKRIAKEGDSDPDENHVSIQVEPAKLVQNGEYKENTSQPPTNSKSKQDLILLKTINQVNNFLSLGRWIFTNFSTIFELDNFYFLNEFVNRLLKSKYQGL